MKSPRTTLAALAAGAAAVLTMALSAPLASAAQPDPAAVTCAQAQDALDEARALDPMETDGSDTLETDGSDKPDGADDEPETDGSDEPETDGSDTPELGDLPPFDASDTTDGADDELDGESDVAETNGSDTPETDGSDTPEDGEVDPAARQAAIAAAEGAVNKACTGPQGPKGDKGEKGDKGDPGKSIPCGGTCTTPCGVKCTSEHVHRDQVVIVDRSEPVIISEGTGSRTVGQPPTAGESVVESDLVVTH